MFRGEDQGTIMTREAALLLALKKEAFSTPEILAMTVPPAIASAVMMAMVYRQGTRGARKQRSALRKKKKPTDQDKRNLDYLEKLDDDGEIRKKAMATGTIAMGSGTNMTGPTQVPGMEQTTPPEYVAPPPIFPSTTEQPGQPGQTPGMSTPPSESQGMTYSYNNTTTAKKKPQLAPSVPETQMPKQVTSKMSETPVAYNGAVKKTAEELVDGLLHKRAKKVLPMAGDMTPEEFNDLHEMYGDDYNKSNIDDYSSPLGRPENVFVQGSKTGLVGGALGALLAVIASKKIMDEKGFDNVDFARNVAAGAGIGAGAGALLGGGVQTLANEDSYNRLRYINAAYPHQLQQLQKESIMRAEESNDPEIIYMPEEAEGNMSMIRNILKDEHGIDTLIPEQEVEPQEPSEEEIAAHAKRMRELWEQGAEFKDLQELSDMAANQYDPKTTMKKTAEEFVDARIRKRAQDGGMLQAAQKHMPSYPKGSQEAAQAAVNKAMGVKTPITPYTPPANPAQAEQLMKRLYPSLSLNKARMAYNKMTDPYSPKSVGTIVNSYKPYLQPKAQAAADKALSLQPVTVAQANKQAAKYKGNQVATNTPDPATTATATPTTTTTPPVSKGLPVNAPNQPLPVTRKNPYQPDMAKLKQDLKSMNRPQYTPQKPLDSYGTISVRKGVPKKLPTPSPDATGGIDPATYKGELQDVVYGDKHFRLPRFQGKTRDFLKANPLWNKSGEEYGLQKNYAAKRNIPKKAEELVDGLLLKRAACGKSHTSKGKKRNKYVKNLKKKASETPESPENAMYRIDEAVNLMVKEAGFGDANKPRWRREPDKPQSKTEPVKKKTKYGFGTKSMEQKLEPTQDRIVSIDDNLKAVRELIEALRGDVKEGIKGIGRTAADPEVASSAVPGPVAGAIAGGGGGLLMTRLLKKNPSLTNYLTGAGIGTGLGIISSLAAKRYAKDLATNINKSMAATNTV